MRVQSIISTVDSHTAGEPTRVVVGGMPILPGRTLQEQHDALRDRFDYLRGILVGEPRGHAPTHAVLPVMPSHPEADIGFLFLSALGWLPMCGHALIGAVTSLLEIGMLRPESPVTHLTVETLAGLIRVEAEVSDSSVGRVAFSNAPAWVLAPDVHLNVPEVGPIYLSIVYGGLWYAVLDVQQLGLGISLATMPRLLCLSQAIRTVLNERLASLIASPARPAGVPQLLYIGPPETPGADGRNLATSTELGFDRSPCGTGSSARMALLHSQGQLRLGETFVHESVLGTLFEGRLIESRPVDDRLEVVPWIRGAAYVTALSQLVVDPDDPLATGFFVPP